jgi:hypothetical protein
VLSRGSSRATERALKSSEYRAITLPQCPHYLRGIETATTVTRGGLAHAAAFKELESGPCILRVLLGHQGGPNRSVELLS